MGDLKTQGIPVIPTLVLQPVGPAGREHKSAEHCTV